MKHTFIIYLCAFLLVIFRPLSISAQNFERIDSLAFNASKLVTRTPADLAAFAKANANNNTEIVRFFYVWIARNIRYDHSAYVQFNQNGGLDIGKQNAQTVFESRQGVCSGYSRLMELLCAHTGIPARYVAGHAKSYLAPKRIEPHAWNAIRIDGEWSLFDVTWASNSLQSDSSDLSTKFERWWMSGPEDFSRLHLPYDPVFQMTKDLTTRTEFFGDTEGSVEVSLSFDALQTLNEEISLDSLEFNWRSYRRAHVFAKSDTVVATKLARLQDERAKAAFKIVEDFMAYSINHLKELTREELKEWLTRLEQAKEPAREALLSHAEIEDLPVSDRVVEIVQKNRRRLTAMSQFLPLCMDEIKRELGKRD